MQDFEEYRKHYYKEKVNIAHLSVGRHPGQKGADVLAIVFLDSAADSDTPNTIKKVENVSSVKSVDLPESGQYPGWMS